MFSRLCFVAVQSVCAVSVMLSQDKLVSTETIERVKTATVPVVCISPSDDGTFKGARILGSAFFVNDEGHFLTAGHIFNDWERVSKTPGGCFPAIYMAIGGWRTDHPNPSIRFFRFETCRQNQAADLAVCKPTDNPFADPVVKKQVKFLTFSPFLGSKDGTQIAYTGFPFNLLRPVTAKGYISSYIETDKKIVIDGNAWPGASGSPIYLHDGTVVGVLIETGTDRSIGLTFARPSESVIEFLTQNTIPFHQKT